MLGDAFHEWVGAGMLVLFLLHHIFNFKWSRAVFCGKYTAYRILQTVLVLAILLTMLGSLVSGIILSCHVFTFLGIDEGRSFARTLHLVCAYWNLALLSFHLGLHWNILVDYSAIMGLFIFFIGKTVLLYKAKVEIETGEKIARQKTGMENRRQGLKDIKSLFSPIVIIQIIKFVEKIIHIQKVIIAHIADLFRCHAFRRMFDVLFPKFLCKFRFCDSFDCDRLPFRVRYLNYIT